MCAIYTCTCINVPVLLHVHVPVLMYLYHYMYLYQCCVCVGGSDGTLLFKEEYPVLSMCLDDRAIWVSTTNSCVRKWVSETHYH